MILWMASIVSAEGLKLPGRKPSAISSGVQPYLSLRFQISILAPLRGKELHHLREGSCRPRRAWPFRRSCRLRSRPLSGSAGTRRRLRRFRFGAGFFGRGQRADSRGGHQRRAAILVGDGRIGPSSTSSFIYGTSAVRDASRNGVAPAILSLPRPELPCSRRAFTFAPWATSAAERIGDWSDCRIRSAAVGRRPSRRDSVCGPRSVRAAA